MLLFCGLLQTGVAQTITSATFDFATGVLSVTGTGMTTNDPIDVSRLSIGGTLAPYTLTAVAGVKAASSTTFSFTLDPADGLPISLILDKNGTNSIGGTPYNLAAQTGWYTNSPGSADLTSNPITVSNVGGGGGGGGGGPSLTAGGTNPTYTAGGSAVVIDSNISITTSSPTIASASVSISNPGTFLAGDLLNFTNQNGITGSYNSTTGILTLSGITTVANYEAALKSITFSSSAGDPTSGGTNTSRTIGFAVNDGTSTSIPVTDTVAVAAGTPAPTITSATYNAATGVLAVTGTNLTNGATITVGKLTLTGEGGGTRTLVTSDVTASSATAFSVTLNAADQAAVNLLVNKNGTSSTGGTTYNLAAADDWYASVTAGNTSDATNAVTVSNVPVPTITSATYDASTGALVVTGTNFRPLTGATNDIDASKFTLTGEGGTTYTLSGTASVEITSGTGFTLTLSTTDKAVVNTILNKNGTASTSATTYNLAAAEDWAAGADAAVVVADLTGNGITVSNVAVPTITNATYDASTGVLVVTGTGLLFKTGAANDIVANKFSIAGETGAGAAYTLTNTASVDITSGTAFTLTLSATDKAAINQILNKNGTASTSGGVYNLFAAEDWAAGADAAVVVADLSNGITVSNVPVPAITSAAYNASTGTLDVTGTGLLKLSGATNDIVVTKLTLSGDSTAYTLTTASVEITSGTSFSVTLNATDKAALATRLNKNGTTSTGSATYNLAAAEDWAAGADPAVNVADLSGNGITVSEVVVPVIATVTPSTGSPNTNAVVTLTGTNFGSSQANITSVSYGPVGTAVGSPARTTLNFTSQNTAPGGYIQSADYSAPNTTSVRIVTGINIAPATVVDFTITVDGVPSANSSGTFTAQAPLTVTGVTANNKTYDGNATATLNTSSAALVGLVSPYTNVTLVTTSAAGTFSQLNTGFSQTVTVSGLTLSGADAFRYTLTQPTTTATINAPPPPPKPAPPSGGTFVASSTTVAFGSSVTFSASGWTGSAPLTYQFSYRQGSGSSFPVGNETSTSTYTSSTLPLGAVTVSVTVFDSYRQTATASTTVTIAKANQTVSFTLPETPLIGGSVTLSATASSGLPVTFSVVSGDATISGSVLTVNSAGPVTVRATQAGDNNRNAASADQTITVTDRRSQTITFGSLLDQTTDALPFSLNATASSGLTVTFTVISGPAFIVSNNILSLTGLPGVVTIRASQGGNATFKPATPVDRAFIVTDSSSSFFFGDLIDDVGLNVEIFAPERGISAAAKSGDIAAFLQAGSLSGKIMIVAPSQNLNVSLSFTLDVDGNYSIPFTSAGRALTLSGSLGGSILTGNIPALHVKFATQIQSKTGVTAGLAGYYQANSLNAATGGTDTLVLPNGQIFVVASTSTVTTGGVGTIAANGAFTVAAPGATITGAVSASNTSISGTIAVPGQPVVSVSGLSSSTVRTDRLVNLSSRVRVSPVAANTLITGFVIGGTTPKRVLLRAVGPALSGFGVTGVLSNPRLDLYDGTGKLVVQNDDWSGTDTAATFTQVGAFGLATGSRDAALVTTLAPGAYTMLVSGGTETGVALAEIYDASTSPAVESQRLVNISTRGAVGAGEGALIGGFVVTGNTSKKMLIRGVGPGLAAFGVTGTLADPRLGVYRDSTLVAQNNDWSTPLATGPAQIPATGTEIADAARNTGAFAFGANSKDAAIIITLAPGAYTAQVTSADGTSTGVALVEIYEVPQ